MTGYEAVLQEALARLKANPPVTPGDSVRRAHRTIVPKASAPATHLIDGDIAAPSSVGAKNCRGREAEFTVSLFVRSDTGPSAADPYKEKVYARLAPAWPEGVMVSPGRVSIDTEIADGDAIRIDLDFKFYYPTAGEWFI